MSRGKEMIVCPYNSSHQVMSSRMASHLIKCRQQYEVRQYETCPFNSTHHVPAPEIQYHMGVCSDRHQLEKNLYVIDEPAPKKEGCLDIDLPEFSENWDEEVQPGGSYLEAKKPELEKQHIFRLPVGMTKSERKKFFQNETLKFGQAGNESPQKE